jgi:uncharacterized RmlC-like cupin family protein
MSLTPSLLLAAGLVVVGYLALGNLWHRVLSPLPAPDPATYPVAGDRLVCASEGVEMHILDVRNGMVSLRAVLGPNAGGPPMHRHAGFDETFAPVKGVLHVELTDRIVTLHPGDSLHIPAGTAHRPFNPGQTPVLLESEAAVMPLSFAASLVQLYHVMDHRGHDPLAMLLQMSIIDPIADTELARVPVAVQKVMRVVLAPAARLLGFRNYHPEYALHPPSNQPQHALAGP